MSSQDESSAEGRKKRNADLPELPPKVVMKHASYAKAAKSKSRSAGCKIRRLVTHGHDELMDKKGSPPPQLPKIIKKGGRKRA